MKRLSDLFPNISTEKIANELEVSGIRIDNSFCFANINIVIGPNGSGKTRFLKCIRSLYKLEDQASILYGYLPALSDHKVNEEATTLPEYSLVDTFSDEDATFEDLFKAIEADCEGFILELLKYKSKKQKERGEAAWEKIQVFFERLSEKRLMREENGLFVLYPNGEKYPLKTALNSFSPGELMLFYMAIFLTLKENGKKRKAIILDEPESHLHPKALLSFIHALIKVHNDTEIWIATHSLFIVPEFEFENIVYIDSNKVSKRTGKMYEEVMSSVLGENNIKVSQFIASLSQWQYCEYLAECFTNPTIVDSVNPHDEQVLLFKKYLKEHRSLRILDFGGGSARLGKSLQASGADMNLRFRYEMLDNNPQYKGTKFKVYKSFSELKRINYDCIVMMNVLHEIAPSDWPDIFRKLCTHMKEDACIVFVETSVLSKGEMPNDIGYLVLSEKELRILFDFPHPLPQLKIAESQKSTCVLLPKSCLLNITASTVNRAIEQLKKRAWIEIKKYRNQKAPAQALPNTRNYAFWTQMYINAELYIDSLSTPPRRTPQKTAINTPESILQKIKSKEIISNIYSDLLDSSSLFTLTIDQIDSLKNQNKDR